MKDNIFYSSPLGTLEIQIKNHKLYSIQKASPSKTSACGLGKMSGPDKELIKKTILFLNHYFLGKQKENLFLPVFLRGSLFQQKVWHCLTQIPYGQTKCYSDIAKVLGSPYLARAVGLACGKNPFLIIVPCHRVVAKKGLGGFALGLMAKKFLLTHEQKYK